LVYICDQIVNYEAQVSLLSVVYALSEPYD